MLDIKNLLSYQEMLERALEGGYISEDEHALLDSISENYGIYEKSLKKAIEDGIISDIEEEENMRNLRKKIYEDALKIALADGIITDDEKGILDNLKTTVGLDDYTLELIEKRVGWQNDDSTL
ncbi:MAG: hypothetical protein V3R82_04285 [Candidatus Hydrothermarchaeales archaeon]